ncbi:hypothetical protein PsorP6_013359 [Peronosclerospora sorghi]|uniref:Uncharacterized protein n=1 Tax=Peronosclerospora sorghi TaxID=230839 RepID=A0ACC0WI93_9STRA|nr:hypothetical protein PsorP6_013359 [Peronosclerospora sorghi]
MYHDIDEQNMHDMIKQYEQLSNQEEDNVKRNAFGRLRQYLKTENGRLKITINRMLCSSDVDAVMRVMAEAEYVISGAVVAGDTIVVNRDVTRFSHYGVRWLGQHGLHMPNRLESPGRTWSRSGGRVLHVVAQVLVLVIFFPTATKDPTAQFTGSSAAHLSLLQPPTDLRCHLVDCCKTEDFSLGHLPDALH